MLELSLGAAAKGAKCEELEKIVIGNDEEKFFQVGAKLPHWEKKELIGFLRKNIDVFAWSAYKAPGRGFELHLPPFKRQSIYRPKKNNHLNAHPKNILMPSRKKC